MYLSQHTLYLYSIHSYIYSIHTIYHYIQYIHRTIDMQLIEYSYIGGTQSEGGKGKRGNIVQYCTSVQVSRLSRQEFDLCKIVSLFQFSTLLYHCSSAALTFTPPKSDQSLICLDLQRVVSSLCCPHVVMVILPPFPDEGSLFTVVKAALAARHRNHLSTSCISSPPS